MTTLLPLLLLLLLLRSAAGNQILVDICILNDECTQHYSHTPKVAIKAFQCLKPPCHITYNINLTLALPFLLSLERKGQLTDMWLYNTGGKVCGLMALWWETENLLMMEGATCDEPNEILKVNYTFSSSNTTWAHFTVVMEEQQVKLYPLEQKDKLFILNCQDYSPSFVTVVSYESRYGYSSLTNHPTNNHLLLLVGNLYIVVVIVVIAVMVWYMKAYCIEATTFTAHQMPQSHGSVGGPVTQTTTTLTLYGSESNLCWPPDLLAQYEDDRNSLALPAHDDCDSDTLSLPSFSDNYDSDSDSHRLSDLFTHYDCHSTT